MQVLNLDEKNTERMDAINKFTLMDDTFIIVAQLSRQKSKIFIMN